MITLIQVIETWSQAWNHRQSQNNTIFTLIYSFCVSVPFTYVHHTCQVTLDISGSPSPGNIQGNLTDTTHKSYRVNLLHCDFTSIFFINIFEEGIHFIVEFTVIAQDIPHTVFNWQSWRTTIGMAFLIGIHTVATLKPSEKVWDIWKVRTSNHRFWYRKKLLCGLISNVCHAVSF